MANEIDIFDLEEINKKIIRQDENSRIYEYYKSNPQKLKEARKKWNDKNRREYQRQYRLNKKKFNHDKN